MGAAMSSNSKVVARLNANRTHWIVDRCPYCGGQHQHLIRAEEDRSGRDAPCNYRKSYIFDLAEPSPAIEEMTKNAALAQVMAEQLFGRAVEWPRLRNLHFSVLVDYIGEPPFQFMWQYKNVRGATFTKADRDAAVQWIKTAMLAGYTVFHNFGKRGGGQGRGLEHGPFTDDIGA